MGGAGGADTSSGRRSAPARRPRGAGGDRVRHDLRLHLAAVAGGLVRSVRATAHRWFTEWAKARVRTKLHRLVLDELGSRGELDWSRCAIDSVNLRALKMGT